MEAIKELLNLGQFIILVGGAVWGIGAIKSTTEVLNNTIENLKKTVEKLETTVTVMNETLYKHAERIAVLEHG